MKLHLREDSKDAEFLTMDGRVNDWKDIQDYGFDIEKENGEIYSDGAYFTITYSPSLKKYSWTSSIEFEAEDVFDTKAEAYHDAVEVHTPDDGSDIYVYEI